MKNLLLLLALLVSNQNFFLQTQAIGFRTITGLVVDETNSPVIFASVTSYDLSVTTTSDLDGRFKLIITDTTTKLRVTSSGFGDRVIDITGKDSVKVVMHRGTLLKEAVIIAYKVPLIEQDNTTQGGITTSEQIRNLPTKSVNEISATTAGLSTVDGGKANIRGSRDNATNYYVDGIRVSGSGLLPNQNEIGFNTEEYGRVSENIFHNPQDEALSTFSIDVDAASYANVRRFLTQGEKPPVDAVRIEEMVNYFDYVYPQPEGSVPFAIISEVGECPWNNEHKLVHVGLQGKNIATEDLPASNLVFLIDVSGSMESPFKLPLVISSFKLLTEMLREDDKVAIVVYAGAAGLVLPSTSGDNKDAIYEALDKLRAGGSTAGAGGIKLAYSIARENFIKEGNNRVVLATDGDFNVGVSSEGELVKLIEKERESGVFLSVLGFGTGNLKDSKMEQLADHGNGNFGYVDNINEAKKVFVHEFGGTLFTIAKDVKIQVEFNPALVAEYRLIGYENRLLASEDFNDDKKDAGEIGSGHSVTALYEIIPVQHEKDAGKKVDELKYQENNTIASGDFGDELMTIKFRYKEPDGNKSKLITQVIHDTHEPFNATSENFRWSASVAVFGMLLRESKFVTEVSFEDVEMWASEAKGNDENGYRKEFLHLVKERERLEY